MRSLSRPLPIARPAPGRRRAGLLIALRYATLVLAGLTMVVPFVWMLTTSLKAPGAVLTIPPQILPRQLTLESYARVAETVPLLRMLGNSVLVTVACVAGQLATSALSAYAFARMRWRGRDALFTVYLATLMVPQQVTITPLFILMQRLGWVDTYQGLIAPGLVSAFGTFLLRQAMLGVPREYEEAALLDGGSHWTLFRHVCLPLVGPSLATLAVLATMSSWNSFLWPLFITRDERLMTLPVGLALLHGRYTTEWSMVMAGAVITVLPIILVYLAAQRAFVRGVALSGLK
ncbi:MAG TPA: carbohydrate ABC transporter permease [Chloroflexaceae bacterium]|nr:carbohydrate ABC transporter permease [Chloroflexaceae bacterium]